MADAREHGLRVLGAIIPVRRDLLNRALARLTPDHFIDGTQQKFFVLLQRYYDRTGGVLQRNHLADIFRNQPVGQAELFEEFYDLAHATVVSDEDFEWSVEQLRDIAAERATGDALATAMTILRSGLDDGQGNLRRGHLAARTAILEAITVIDRDLTMQEAPEGLLSAEKDDILADYQARKAARLSGESQGILFGIPNLDEKVGGMQNGELVLLAGYSSDGKSSLAVQTAWSTAVEQGKNVLFLTTETLRAQIRRKIVARHSKMAQFGLPEGINSRYLKAGTLPEHLEPKLAEVVDDLTRNSGYGQIYVAQVPRGGTISSIEQRMMRVQKTMNIDLVIMDYLALLATERGRTTTREELSGIIKEAKQVCTTFDGGRGVPFLSPWQVTRAAREQAERDGMYNRSATSETAEATNSADLLIALLAPQDNNDRYAEVSMQVLKSRDGETANGLVVSVDYATSWFGTRQSVGQMNHGGMATPTAGLESLLT